MKKLTYAEQLAHPLWQRRRLEMLSAAEWACTSCGSTEQQLHVHHRAYFKGRKVWEYADHELAVLCSTCHGAEHDAKALLDELLLAVPHADQPIARALAILSGYFGACNDRTFDISIRISDAGTRTSASVMAGFIAFAIQGIPERKYAEILGFINTLRAQEGLDEL